MRNMFFVSVFCTLAFIGQLSHAETSTKMVITLALDGPVQTEPLRVKTSSKIRSISQYTDIGKRKKLLSPKLKNVLISSFRIYSIEKYKVPGDTMVLLINRPSRSNMAAGYCGAGHETELLLVSAVGNELRLRDSFSLESCSYGLELTRDFPEFDIEISENEMIYKRNCDPIDVFSIVSWGKDKFKNSFKFDRKDPIEKITSLLNRTKLVGDGKREIEVGDEKNFLGVTFFASSDMVGRLVVGALHVRPIGYWPSKAKSFLALEVVTQPKERKDAERNLILLKFDEVEYKIIQFSEVSRYDLDAMVETKIGQAVDQEIKFPLGCGTGSVRVSLSGDHLEFE